MDTPPSSFSESPMFEIEERHKDTNDEKPGPFSGGTHSFIYDFTCDYCFVFN